MRLLLTSDWQTDASNIDLCRTSLKELLAAADKYQPDAIIHAGDLKEQYSPVAVVVPQFWVRATRQILKAGHRFIVLRGNHDRSSQSRESKDWLDILRAAGAETVSTPQWLDIGDGRVAFLPYTSDKKQEVAWARQLAAESARGATALVFHTEVKDARFNSAGMLASGSSAEALFFKSYTACLGGHLHGHQKVADNAWYIGSPFCHEWGEANDKKGHLLADIDSSVRLRFIRTMIPGWYDVEHLEMHNLEPEPGAMVRSRVEVTSRKITDRVCEEEKRLRDQYGEAVKLFVVPKLVKTDEQDILLDGDTDEDRIAGYVASTMGDGARFTAAQVCAYLMSKIGPPAAGGIQGARFLGLTAHNVLPFKDVTVSYDKQGLVLLRGVNRDWGERSNGSGKTSLLALLLVALNGVTLKKQRFDGWACEYNEDLARLELHLQDGRGRSVEIERSRRPGALYLRIDGEDRSVGLKSSGKEETQGLIERTIGMDMRMLLNSVYIDQTIANGFVFGTQKDRMDLVAKICDLQRFGEAIKKIDKDLAASRKEQERLNKLISDTEIGIDYMQDALVKVEGTKESGAQERLYRSIRQMDKLVKAHAALSDSSKYIADQQSALDELMEQCGLIDSRIGDVKAEILTWERRIKTANKLVAERKCAVCEQPAEQAGSQMLSEAKAELKSAVARSLELEQSKAKMQKQARALEKEIRGYEQALSRSESEISSTRNMLRELQSAADEEALRNSDRDRETVELRLKLKKAKRKLGASLEALYTTMVDQELLEFAKKACSRDGIPMYLAGALCPVLNKAAAEYAEVFNGGRLQVGFGIEDGEFCANIINTAGSATSVGQSVGESAMAGIVAAFALREVAPKTNLLILDEPGHGLDPVGAKQFAQGILKLKDRFETIIVTTHSPIIEAVLSGETVWTVEKSGKYSVLKTEAVTKAIGD